MMKNSYLSTCIKTQNAVSCDTMYGYIFTISHSLQKIIYVHMCNQVHSKRTLSSLQGLFTKPSYVMQLQKLRPDVNIECIIFLLKDEINVVSSNIFRIQLDVDCSKKF